MRGMVFGAEADKLIVRATPEDVRRYTTGQAVAVLAQDGWEMSPIRPPRHMMDRQILLGDQPREIAVTLRTACGCERDHVVPYPPPMELRIALYSHITSVATLDALAQVTATVRRYALKEYGRRQVTQNGLRGAGDKWGRQEQYDVGYVYHEVVA